MDTIQHPDYPGIPKWRVLLWRLAHAAPWGYGLLASIQIVALLTGLRDNPVYVWIAFALTPLGTAFFAAVILHRDRICLVCAAITPLDGPAAAEKSARQLNFYHNAKLRLGLLGALLLVAFACVFFIGDSTGLLIMHVTSIVLAYIWFTDTTHSVLRPWCPHCRRGRRDDREHFEPVPPPPGPTATPDRDVPVKSG